MTLTKKKTLLEHVQEVTKASLGDKQARLESSMVANAIYTGLNVAISAIPFGKFFLDDATSMRMTQSLTGDKNFRILYDQNTPKQEDKKRLIQQASRHIENEKLIKMVGRQINNGNEREALKAMTGVERQVRQTANGRGTQANNARVFLDTWRRAASLAANPSRLMSLRNRQAAKTNPLHPASVKRQPVTLTEIIQHPAFNQVVQRHKQARGELTKRVA